MKDETLIIEKIIQPPIREHLFVLNNHLNRYNTAARALHLTKEHLLIDASCGHGYGSYILSSKVSATIGLDINPDYLKTAAQNFASDNLSFYTYDHYDQIKRDPNGWADRIVCIETIEHLPKEALTAYVKRLLSYLKKGGWLFVTFPVGDDSLSSYNPYHLNEPSLSSVHKIFSSLFASMSYELDSFVNSFGFDTTYCYLTLKDFGK